MSQTLPVEIADAILRIESQTFVRQVDWFSEIGSTNDYALQIGGEPDIILPRLIWADRQHAGRGRSGHAWWSAAGALTFSLLVDTSELDLPVEHLPRISLLTGLAIAETLNAVTGVHSAQVKWPNDVFIQGRKVCGILIEPHPARSSRLVVGIGINVLNSFESAPLELRQTATSLCDCAPVPGGPVALLLDLLQAWPALIQNYALQKWSLRDRWAPLCYLSDRGVRITAGPKTFDGICRGVDDDGALLIDSGNKLQRHVAGTVRVIHL